MYVPTYVLAVVKYADGFSGVPLLRLAARRDPEEDD
jgi:hypothetical protein